MTLALLVACGRGGDPMPELPAEPGDRCTGQWIETSDTLPVLQGFTAYDADGREIEERIEAIGVVEGSGHEWWAWDGTGRLSEHRLDYMGSDDVADQVEVYAYDLDDRLRLVWMGVAVGESLYEETYTYDDLDQLVATDLVLDDAPFGGERFAWEDGRLVRTDSLDADGEIWATVTREYLSPPPSLDRIETGPAGSQRLDVDDADRVLARWVLDDAGAETLLERREWDADGQPLSWLSVRDVEPTPYESSTTWTYGDDGRVHTERTELDGGRDGIVDRIDETTWYWSCE